MKAPHILSMIIACAFSIFSVQANTVHGRDELCKIHFDQSGTMFTVGSFTDSINDGGQAFIARGACDAFVASYDMEGNLRWRLQFSGPQEEKASLMTLDAGGNLYVAGWFSDSITIGDTTLKSAGGKDVFLACIDPVTGDCLWATRMGDGTDDFPEFLILSTEYCSVRSYHAASPYSFVCGVSTNEYHFKGKFFQPLYYKATGLPKDAITKE